MNEMKQGTFHTGRSVFLTVLIGLFLLIIYSNSLQAPFVYDDWKQIVKRPALHMTRLTPSSVCRTFFKITPEGNIVSRPLSNLSFALNYYFGRLQVTGYHLVNILIHLITACFLFNILYFLIKQGTTRFTRGEMLGMVGLATVLWAAHPIQTQAVTYIVQRMASLAAMFYVLGLWSYLGFRRRLQTGKIRAGGKWLALSGVFFVCAVFSKPNAVIFPVGLLLVEYFFFNKDEKGGRRLKMMAVFGGTALVILTAGLFFVMKLDPAQLLAGYDIRPFTLGERLLTEPRVLFLYLSQLFYPVPARFSIKHYLPLSHSLFDPVSTVLAIVGVVVLVACALYWGRRYPLIGFPLVFYFSHHLVESSIVPRALIYEHRNYLPSLFVFLPVALMLVFGLKVYRKRSLLVWGAVFLFSTALVFLLGLSTHTRNQDWQSRKTLWKSALRVAPEICRPYHGLGRFYSVLGTRGQERARVLFEQGTEKKPYNYVFEEGGLWLEIARIHAGRGQWRQAKAAAENSLGIYKEIIRSTPDALVRPKIRQNLSGIYYYLSHLASAFDAHEALDYINQALEYQKNADYFVAKARYQHQAGDYRGGLQTLRRAVKKDPRQWNTAFALGHMLTFMGDYDRAYWFYKQALDLAKKQGKLGSFQSIYLHLSENRCLAGDSARSRQYLENYLKKVSFGKVTALVKQHTANVPGCYPFVDTEIMLRRIQTGICRKKGET